MPYQEPCTCTLIKVNMINCTHCKGYKNLSTTPKCHGGICTNENAMFNDSKSKIILLKNLKKQKKKKKQSKKHTKKPTKAHTKNNNKKTKKNNKETLYEQFNYRSFFFVSAFISHLSLSMLGKISVDNSLKYFPLKIAIDISPRLGIDISCLGYNLHEMSKSLIWEK